MHLDAAGVLKPTDAKARLVGRALTVMNIAATCSAPEAVAGGVSGLAEIEAHNLAELGEVLPRRRSGDSAPR